MSTYTVRPGDTLGQIAARYQTTVAALAAANNIKNPNVIHVGQTLKLSTVAPVPQVELGRGSNGDAVRQLQAALVKLGHMSQAEMNTGPGVYGPRTEQGVRRFQKANGVSQTGFYGPQTRAALSRALVAPPSNPAVAVPQGTLRKGSSGPEVEKLQLALVKLGFMTQSAMNTGPGTFGSRTDASLRSFQRAAGIGADGVYGPQSRAALQSALQNGGVKPGPTPPTGPTPPPPANGTFTKPKVVNTPSPNFNSRGGKDIDTIVLHHTASNNGAGDLAWMRNPNSQVSAHYMVDTDGTVYQLVGDDKRAWHAGTSQLHGVPTDVNGRSIGIEIVNDGSGHTPFTEAQYRAVNQLVGYLQQQYDVPMKNIVGHKDVAVPRGRKNDPAANFDWNRALANVG